MTLLQKDAMAITNGYDVEVLKRRKAEIKNLENAVRCEKNGFKRTCAAQDLVRKVDEYSLLERVFEGQVNIEDLF